MKKYLQTLLFLLLLTLTFSCTLTTEEDKGSISLTLPTLSISSRSPTSPDTSFPQIVREYSVVITPSHLSTPVFQTIISATEKSVTVDNLVPQKYKISVSGETDTDIYSKTVETAVHAGDNSVTIDLIRTSKSFRGYYINGNAKTSGNGTKTYPYKSISEAFSLIPIDSSEVTLFLEGEFTESITLNSSSRFTKINLRSAPHLSKHATLVAPSVPGDQAPQAESIITIDNPDAIVDILDIDFSSNEEIKRNSEQQVGNGVINVLNGSCTIQNSNISMALLGEVGNQWAGGSGIYVSKTGKLKLGGLINLSEKADIRLELISRVPSVFPIIQLVSNLKSNGPIVLDLQGDIKDGPIKIVEAYSNVDMKSSVTPFKAKTPPEVEYIIDENGYVKKNKVRLNIYSDKAYQKITVTIDGKDFIFNDVKEKTRPPLDTANLILLEIGKTYNVSVKAEQADGPDPIIQNYKITPKEDLQDIHLLKLITTPVSFKIDNSPGFTENKDYGNFTSLQSAIKELKERVGTLPDSVVQATLTTSIANATTSSPIVIDFPIDLSIVGTSETGQVPTITNTTTNIFTIKNNKSNVSLKSITLKGGQQSLPNSGLIKVEQGNVKLICCPIICEPTSSSTNGVYLSENTVLTLEGIGGMESPYKTYNGKIECPIFLENNSLVKIDFEKATPSSINVKVPTNLNTQTIYFKTLSEASLTQDQINAFKIFSDDQTQTWSLNTNGKLGN